MLSFSVFNKFKAIDGVTAPIRKMTKSVGKFGNEAVSAFKRADRASSRFGKKLKGVGRDMSTKMTLPLSLLGVGAIKAALDFESAFTGVRKTVTATEKEFGLLRKELVDITRIIPVSTTEIFGIAEAAGQLGIQQKDIVGFTKVMADLGATTNITAAEAAMSLAKFATITDMAGKDIERLGSTIVDLGNNTATTEADIVAMGMRLAGAGKTIGLTQAQIMSLAASLSSVGLEAEAGGTAFSMVMKKIGKEIGSGSIQMEGFATVSGKTIGQFEKMWKDDAANALVTFTEGLKKVQDQGFNVNQILDGLGLSGIRISDSLLRASGAGDKFRETMALGNKAWEENNALAKEAALRYATAASKLTIFWNNIKILAVTFGNVLLPILIKITNFLTPLLRKFEDLSPGIKTIILVIGGLAIAIGPLLIAFGLMASGITAIIAIGAPVIATISAITATIVGIGSAITMVIKNWNFLKNELSLGVDFITDKLKAITGGVVGKVAGFFGIGRDKQAEQQETPISPNAGLAGAIRQETETRSRVSVDFSNLPKGTKVDESGKVPGFDLELGFAGA